MSVSVYSVHADVYDLDFPYFNDFESPTSVHDGVSDTNHVNDVNGHEDWILHEQWAISASSTSRNSFSGTYFLNNTYDEIPYTDSSGNEIAELNGYIQIPVDAIQPVLKFRYKLELINYFDTLFIEIKEEGSEEWVTIKSYLSEQNHLSAYTQEEISLAQYKGKSVTFRFKPYYCCTEGVRLWNIDDLYIGELTLQQFSYPYANDFETEVESSQWNLQGPWSINGIHNPWVNKTGEAHLDSNPSGIDFSAIDDGRIATLDGYIQIPESANRPTLSFWYQLDLTHSNDRVFVELQEKGSDQWNVLRHYTKQHDHALYTRDDISLSEFKGKDVRLRFKEVNNWYEGIRFWMIDALSVKDFQLGQFEYPYFNDFESEDQTREWNVQGSWRLSNDHGNWTSHSPALHLDNNPDEINLLAFNERQLACMDGYVSIPGSSENPKLSYWYKLQLAHYFDEMTVELQQKNTNDWVVLKTYYEEDNQSGYVQDSISLTNYKGSDIRICFRQNNAWYDGPRYWVIDDVRISGDGDEFDLTPPVITIESPAVDNSYTNQLSFTVMGELDEYAALSINGSPVIVNGDYRFTQTVTLEEGINTLTLRAIDGFANESVAVITLYRDTVPPRQLALLGLNVVQLPDGSYQFVSEEGVVDEGDTVQITNTNSGEVYTTTADEQGRFTLAVQGNTEDLLQIAVIDVAGNTSEITNYMIGVPVDPAAIAPAFSSAATFTSMHDAVSFLYTGPMAVQTGMSSDTIEAKRVAVLKGRVTDRNNQAIPNVDITVHNHPEFGQTKTRIDGHFDMAVNGGSHLVVNYRKEGYLPVQRIIDTPWQNYSWADDVIMIQLDDQVSTIDLTSTQAVQVAQGSAVTDEDGTRQATILFPQGTTANMILPDGSTQTLSTLNVRATEYTIGDSGPQAMPGELPPVTAYTYALELSVDEAIAAGATRVEFNQPLPFYVNNFLDVKDGEAVPVGWYDYESASWVSSDDGYVVQIIAITNGQAEIDIEGDGIVSDQVVLDTLNITQNELITLAGLYEAGDSLWRVQVSHFTPYDMNWVDSGLEYEIEGDGTGPSGSPSPAGGGGNNNRNDPDSECNSIIECQGQVLGETLPITGSEFTLNYKSDRVEGRKSGNIISIPITGATVPANVTEIELTIQLAGRRFTETLGVEANQTYEFEWDGRDAYGRLVTGPQTARVNLSYSYPTIFASGAIAVGAIARSTRSFRIVSSRTLVSRGGSPGIDLAVTRRTSLYKRDRDWDIRINPATVNVKALGFGGWTLSQHHTYDPAGKVLIRGDGTKRTASNQGEIIREIAGGGSANSGNGGPAIDAGFGNPAGIAINAQGEIYIADSLANQIRKIDSDGMIDVYAGIGTQGFSGDGGQAVQAQLADPVDLAIAANGDLYISDIASHCIRKVGSNGVIQTFAGVCGSSGYNEDLIPANEALLNAPRGIALSPTGGLYIADSGNHRIRYVTPDGNIQTFAGTGVAGYAGDQGFVSDAQFFAPSDVALDDGENLYIADTNNDRIRKITSSGYVTTVAGGGTEFTGLNGDGGPAVQAILNRPGRVAIDNERGIYITDTGHDFIRYVALDGTIGTVAGFTGNDSALDRNFAQANNLDNPLGIALGHDARIYFTEGGSARTLRAIEPALAGYTGQAIDVISADSTEKYSFDPNGRHLSTTATDTGVVLYQFGYDTNGYLQRITDAYANETIVNRSISGDIESIETEDGVITTLSLDANGYLQSVSNPENETYRFTYTDDGLLTAMTNPRDQSSSINYDNLGHLIRDENAAGGAFQLRALSSTFDENQIVELEAPLGSTKVYHYEKNRYGVERRIEYPDGTEQQRRIQYQGVEVTTEPDGTVISEVYGANPRYGAASAVLTQSRITTPDGLSSNSVYTTEAELSNAEDPDSLVTLTETVSVNGRRYESVYSAASNTYAYVTPQNRLMTEALNAQGDVIAEQIFGLEETRYIYDNRGRIERIETGTGDDTRATRYTYNGSGFLESVTDPLDQLTEFTYDAAGRVITQTLPDTRVVNYGYDQSGNLNSITPDGRPVHSFLFNEIDQETEYSPPGIGLSSPQSTFTYDLDKNLTGMTLPDGDQVTLNYDNVRDRLTSINTPRGDYSFTYLPETGQVGSATSPDNITLQYTYDGFLDKSSEWSGEVAGRVEAFYSNNLWVNGYNVNGTYIGYSQRDADGNILRVDNPVGSGNLEFTRNPATGLITGTTQGAIEISHSYSSFGELRSTSMEGDDAALSSSITGTNISAETLLVSGVVENASRVSVNNIEMTVSAAGQISGVVPLNPGFNNLLIEAYDQQGEQTVTDFNTVNRIPLQTGFNINGIHDIDAAGFVYFSQGGQAGQSGDVWRLNSTTGAPELPVWLQGASDASVDQLGNVYTIKDTQLWRFDGENSEMIAELSALDAIRNPMGDMVAGHDGFVYVAGTAGIYRISATGDIELRQLCDASEPSVGICSANLAFRPKLSASSWGVAINYNNGFYRMLPDGRAQLIFNEFFGSPNNFSVASDGTICYYVSFEIVQTFCRDPSTGDVTQLPINDFNTNGIVHAENNVLHYSTNSNVYRFINDGSTALLTSSAVPSQGELVLSGSASNAPYQVSYERDKLGRIIQKTEILNGALNITDYDYDPAGRLQVITVDGVETQRYTYDSNDNRTHINGIEIAQYDDQDRMLSYNGVSYSYDDAGNLESRTEQNEVTQYHYDVFGNLIDVTLPDSRVISYIIDAQNRRIGKRIDGQLIQGFLYQDQLNPIAELDSNNQVVSRFVYAEKANVPSYMIKDGISYRIISDYLGSPRVIANTATGEIVQQMDYDEWGNVINDTNPGFQPFGFAGGIYDRDTSLTRFGARDYDAETGRWTAKDPIRFEGKQSNLYVYVYNDPINWVDPSGEAGLIGWAIGVGTVGYVAYKAGVFESDRASGVENNKEKWKEIMDHVNDPMKPTEFDSDKMEAEQFADWVKQHKSGRELKGSGKNKAKKLKKWWDAWKKVKACG